MVEGFAAHWLGRGEVHDEAVATRTLTQLWVRGLGMPARIAVAGGQIPTASRPATARTPRPTPRPAPRPAPRTAPHPAPRKES